MQVLYCLQYVLIGVLITVLVVLAPPVYRWRIHRRLTKYLDGTAALAARIRRASGRDQPQQGATNA